MFVIIILLLFIFGVTVFIMIPLMIGASFEITDDKSLRIMLKLARAKKGEKAAELGSGDGKILLALAKAGAETHGFEINPFLVLWTKWKIKKAKLKGKAFVHWKSFWSINLGDFDVITIFQVGYIMKKLKEKLECEARKKIRIVSNTWQFPEMKYLKKEGNIFLYELAPQKNKNT